MSKKTQDRPVAEARAESIVGLVESMGHVSVADLANRFNVCEMTIRRDLALLEKQGRLVKTHGGAVRARTAGATFSFSHGTVKKRREKIRIAERALPMIHDNDMALMDTGSTIVELARLLNPAAPVTVITCSLSVLGELYAKPRVNLTLVGGDVSKEKHEVYGPITEQIFGAIKADIAFMGADGISLETGFGSNSIVGARIPGLMIRAARKTVVLADRTKLGVQARIKYADIAGIDCLVTDAPGSDPTIRALKKEGVEVIGA